MKGLRFQRRIRLPFGIRLNLSKSGIGVSAGVPGLRIGVNSKGRKYSTIGAPGTGVSIRNYFGNGRTRPVNSAAPLVHDSVPIIVTYQQLEAKLAADVKARFSAFQENPSEQSERQLKTAQGKLRLVQTITAPSDFWDRLVGWLLKGWFLKL
jgi:hypothetical protein